MEDLKSPEVGKSQSPGEKREMLPLEVVDQVASCYDLDVALIFAKKGGSIRILCHGRRAGDKITSARLSQLLRKELEIPIDPAEASALQLMQKVNREMYLALLDLKTEIASILPRPQSFYPEERKELSRLVGKAESAMVLFEKFDRVEEVQNAGS